MQLREISNKQDWEAFVSSCAPRTFLQSWNWGEYQAALGNAIWRVGVTDGNRVVAVALVVKISARRGTFLFVPHGPLMGESLPAAGQKKAFSLIMEFLTRMGREESADFIRVAPLFANIAVNQALFTGFGFRSSPMHASAYEATWKLDITGSEEELQKSMRKTTRQLIRKAAGNPDIAIEVTEGLSALPQYQALNEAVGRRQQFTPFSAEQTAKELEIFARDKEAAIVLGKYRGKPVAGALVVFWAGIGFYHQAASLGEFSKLSVPYLLQWECVKEAKRRGCRTYDFWGFTDPQKFPKHPWAGPTLFKMGFGGASEEYLKTQDLPLTAKYWLNYGIELARKIRRGL